LHWEEFYEYKNKRVNANQTIASKIIVK